MKVYLNIGKGRGMKVQGKYERTKNLSIAGRLEKQTFRNSAWSTLSIWFAEVQQETPVILKSAEHVPRPLHICSREADEIKTFRRSCCEWHDCSLLQGNEPSRSISTISLKLLSWRKHLTQKQTGRGLWSPKLQAPSLRCRRGLTRSGGGGGAKLPRQTIQCQGLRFELCSFLLCLLPLRSFKLAAISVLFTDLRLKSVNWYVLKDRNYAIPERQRELWIFWSHVARGGCSLQKRIVFVFVFLLSGFNPYFLY